MDNLSGKKIWIVGASVGIGETLAERLATAGAQLALSARSEDKLVTLSKALPGGPHLAIPIDVTNLSSVQKAWQAIEATWGNIDILIYNAGAYEPIGAQNFNLAKIEAMVDVNFHGALRVLDSVLPVFVKNQRGHIVLVASVAGYSGLPNALGYGASKAALLHLGENLRLDLRKSNVKVQVVSPGFVKTRLTEKNSFPMPFIISSSAAAENIYQGLMKNTFEIHFPKRFSLILKFLRLLPYAIYFRLLRNV